MLTQEKSHDSYPKNELYSLYKVFGLGVKSNYSISQNPINGLMCWITGPYLVFYDIEKDEQISFLKNPNNKILSCVNFSKNGKLISTGEGNCKNGEVSIYKINYDNNEETHSYFCSYKYHKYGIDKILFFNNDNYILSIGDKSDKVINIFDIEKKEVIFSTKYNRQVLSCDVCDEFMILCGNKFIKIYNYEKLLEDPSLGKSGIDKHMIDLSKLNDKAFISTIIFPLKDNQKKIFFLTHDCYLVEMKPKSLSLNRWVHLKSSIGLSLCIYDNKYIGCGCGDGIIRIFNADTLQHYTTLNKTYSFGNINLELNQKITNNPNSLFPDVISVQYNIYHKKLITIYSDKSMFIWDILSNKTCSVYRYNIFHSGSILCLDYDIDVENNLLKLITAGDDFTAIYWNFKLDDFIENKYHQNPKRIAYSKYIRHIFYLSDKWNHFKISKNKLIGEEDDKKEEEDNIKSLTSIRFSPDKNFVCIGDDIGNVYIFSLNNFNLIQEIPIHSGHVNSIDMIEDKEKNKTYFVSGGDDCSIIVIDISNGLNLTIDNNNTFIEKLNSIIVNCVFCIDKNNKIKLVTAEKNSTITFFTIQNDSLQTIQKIKGEPNLQTYNLTNCQSIKKIISGHNGRITIWKTSTCIVHKHFQVNKGDKYLHNFRVSCDSKGLIFATSNNDKNIRIRALHNGSLLTKIQTAESISSLNFIINDNYLIATSVEGYIYFYKLSQEYMNNISKDNNLINSTEEKNKINNKLRFLQKFMENDTNNSKKEHVKYLIDKFQKSEETTIEDLKLLDSFYKENKKNYKDDKKEVKEKPLIELKEDKPKDNDDEENENNDNSHENINKNDNKGFLTRSKIFENGLTKINSNENLLKKNNNINRKSLADSYVKNFIKKEKEENTNYQNNKKENEEENKNDQINDNNIETKIEELNDIIKKNENNNQINNQIIENEPINLNDINLSDKLNERKEEREVKINENKYSNINLNEENNGFNNNNENINEEIENNNNYIQEKIPTSEASKQSFNNKIINNSQSQVNQSFIRNMQITQSNFDINSIISSKNLSSQQYKVINNNFNFVKKKKDPIKKIVKENKFSFNHNIDIKDKLNDDLNKIDVYKLNNSDLKILENNLEKVLDKVRIRLGNQSLDPTMEKLLEKYSLLLLDRLDNKKSNK